MFLFPFIEFFRSSIFSWKRENVSFFLYLWQTLFKERNFFYIIMKPINLNYPWQNWSHTPTDRLLKKNCCKSVSSTLGSKCSKNYFSGFFLPLVMSGLICFAWLTFQSPWWAVNTFCAQDLLKPFNTTSSW